MVEQSQKAKVKMEEDHKLTVIRRRLFAPPFPLSPTPSLPPPSLSPTLRFMFLFVSLSLSRFLSLSALLALQPPLSSLRPSFPTHF